MANPNVTVQGVVQRDIRRTGPLAEQQPGTPRLNHLGEQYAVTPFTGLQAAGVEGSYTSWAQTGTRGTGVNLSNGTGTTYSALQAALIVANTNPDGGPDVVLDYFKILIDAVITAGTFWHVYHAMDFGNRYSSGGALMPALAINGKSGGPPGILAYSGVVVATAATNNVRDVGHNLLLNGVGVANMELVIKFGSLDPGQATFTTPTTGVAQTVVYAPPIVIPPGWCYVMNEFQTARTATGVGEFFLGAIVR